MIASRFELEDVPRQDFQFFNALHAHDLLTVFLIPGRDHRFDFRSNGRGCAHQSDRRLAKIGDLHVRGGGFGNRRYGLQPGVFNFNGDVVRERDVAEAAQE